MSNTQETRQLVCIVDDDLTNAKVLSYMLGREHEVCIAGSGESGLALIEERLPDIVLLDVMMPDIDGFEVCERLQENPVTREIPVIFLTGLEDHRDQVKGFELGAMDYIAKPFHPGVVMARVSRILQINLYMQFLEGMIASKTQSIESLQAQASLLPGLGDASARFTKRDEPIGL